MDEAIAMCDTEVFMIFAENNDFVVTTIGVASSPGHSQILSRSRGEKSGEGQVPLLRHGPEMVDSVST